MAQVVCAGVPSDLNFVNFFVKHHHMDPICVLCGTLRAFRTYIHVRIGSPHPKSYFGTNRLALVKTDSEFLFFRYPKFCTLFLADFGRQPTKTEDTLQKALGLEVSEQFSHAPKHIGGQRYAPNTGTQGQNQT